MRAIFGTLLAAAFALAMLVPDSNREMLLDIVRGLGPLLLFLALFLGIAMAWGLILMVYGLAVNAIDQLRHRR
jgi:hypothetical protein